jgi:hypothetical protein
MPIAKLMGKISSGEIKKVKSVRSYYDQDMPIAELMRKIKSGEIKKIEPRKPVRPRRKLRIVDDDDVKKYRFQEDAWKMILEFLLTPRSKRIVLLKIRLSTASTQELNEIMRKCQIRKKERTNVLRIQSIVNNLKNPDPSKQKCWGLFLDISYSEFHIQCVGDMRLYMPHIRELWQKSHFDCIMKDMNGKKTFESYFETYANDVFKSIPTDYREKRERVIERMRDVGALETDYMNRLRIYIEVRQHEQF